MMGVMTGVALGTAVVIWASICWMSWTALESAVLVATRLLMMELFW
jgi:hypothetical protein